MVNTKFSGYKVAIGMAIVVMFVQGALGTFGVLLPYIISSEGWSVSAVSFMATCCNCIVFVMNTIMYKAISRLGAKKTLLIGIFCCGLHYQLYGLSTAIWQLYLAACVGGVAMGFATNAMLSFILTRWFVDKRERTISLAMIPIGFGGTLFSFISGYAIELLGSWRMAYHIVGALVWVVAIPIAVIMVKESPASVGELPLGATAQVEDNKPKAKVKVSALEEFKTAAFWMMWIGLFLCGFVAPGLTQHFTSILREGGVEAGAASNYLGIGKLFTAVAFLIIGMISGQKNSKKTTYIVVILITATVVISCLSLFVIDGQPASGLMAYVWIALISFGFACTSYHIISTFTVMQAYGHERYAILYGVFQGAAMFAGGFGSLGLGVFFDVNGDYRTGLIVYAIIAIVGMVLVFGAISSENKRRTRKQLA